MMAAADHIEIELEGKGGHAARPHLADRHDSGRRPDHQSAAVDRGAQCRSAGGGRGVDLHVPGRPYRQRHPAARQAARHGAQPDAKRSANFCTSASTKWSRAPRSFTAPTAEDHLHQRLSGAGEPRAADGVCRRRRARNRRQRQGRYRRGAGDGRGGFRLHAGTSGRAPSSSSATATARGCITRLTISTTRRSRSARPIGCGSRKPR